MQEGHSATRSLCAVVVLKRSRVASTDSAVGCQYYGCLCRESSDHAVFNSWDRQPFLTEVGQKAPAPDLNPSYNLIARNFFIGNYGASLAIDNDDGTASFAS